MSEELDPGADTEEVKAPEPPHALPRIRVCGKRQKPDYKPSKKELADWNEKCKQRGWTGWDPKTGRYIGKKAAKKK